MKTKEIEKEICSICGKELTTRNEFDGKIMCDDCLNRETSICQRCHTRVWNDNTCSDDYTVLCNSCYNTDYTRCADCGCIVHLDNACYFNGSSTPYCEDCYDELDNNSAIHDYNYKPDPIFYGKDSLYYGVELEVDCGGEYSENAEKIENIGNEDAEHIYCKHDGSINNGFEIVSHPMTLDYHQKNMNWLELFEKAISMGYKSHNTSTCGLHIHINRKAFGSNYDEQELAIARVVYFVESNWNELVKFSRRHIDNLMRWASKYGIVENVKNTYNKTKKGNLGRYVAVNLFNSNTVEIRIFRGTLNIDTFYATLQLVDEICKRAIEMVDYEFEKMSWLDFVSKINKEEKPELIKYLKLKQLYVNEPIEMESEI